MLRPPPAPRWPPPVARQPPPPNARLLPASCQQELVPTLVIWLSTSGTQKPPSRLDSTLFEKVAARRPAAKRCWLPLAVWWPFTSRPPATTGCKVNGNPSPL